MWLLSITAWVSVSVFCAISTDVLAIPCEQLTINPGPRQAKEPCCVLPNVVRVEKPWAHSPRLPPVVIRLELLHLNRTVVKGTGLPWSRGSSPAPDYNDSAHLQASMQVEVRKGTNGDREFSNSQHVRGVALSFVAQFVHSVVVIM